MKDNAGGFSPLAENNTTDAANADVNNLQIAKGGSTAYQNPLSIVDQPKAPVVKYNPIKVVTQF